MQETNSRKGEVWDLLNQYGKTIDEKELDEVVDLLINKLGFPSLEHAFIHMEANRLGHYDLLTAKNKKSDLLTSNAQLAICNCCGFLKQPNKQESSQLENQCGIWHWFDTQLDMVCNIGESTRLFFYSLQFLAKFWLITFLLYGIYSLVTNITGATQFNIPCTQNTMCSLAIINLGSKMQPINSPYYFVVLQSWLGLGMVCVWVILYIYKSYRERKIQIEQDQKEKTASDFSIIITNLPKSIKTKEQLEDQFKKFVQIQQVKDYIQKITSNIKIPNPLWGTNETQPQLIPYKQEFKIYTLNLTKNFKQIQMIYKSQKESPALAQFKKARKQLTEWVRNYLAGNQLPLTTEQRKAFYHKLELLSRRLVQQRRNIVKKHFTHKQNINKHTNVAFVTFHSNISRLLLCKLYKTSLLTRIKETIAGSFKMVIDQTQIKLQRAPEPQDIVWENIGISLSMIIFRKILTYFLTIIALGLSFLGIYYITVYQHDSNNSVLSSLISIFITIVNMIIGQIVQYLSKFEKDYRTTYYQINLAIKTILAQLVNTVVLTMIADYYIKGNLYKEGGLADDVFYLSVSNAFITPLAKVIDPYYLYLLVMRYYYSDPSRRLTIQSQIQYNRCFEGYQFQFGYQYVYIIKTSIFTSFFMSLQPIIMVFTCVGFILMYLAQKYVLFNHCARPKPSSNIINQSMTEILYFNIIAYALGNLTWNNFLPGDQLLAAANLVPSLIALGLGIAVVLLPVQEVMQLFILEPIQYMNYTQERVFVPDEYDRCNPATYEKGMHSYIKYLKENKKRKLDVDNILKHCFDLADKAPKTQNLLIKPKVIEENDQFSSDTINYDSKKTAKQQPPAENFDILSHLTNLMSDKPEQQRPLNSANKQPTPKQLNLLSLLNPMNQNIQKVPEEQPLPSKFLMSFIRKKKKEKYDKLTTSTFNLMDYYENHQQEQEQNQ